MIRSGVRRIGRGLKRRIGRLVGRGSDAAWASAPAASATPPVSPFAHAAAPSAPVPSAAPVPSPVPPAEPEAEALAPEADTAGEPLTIEQVQVLFEDMVRPALQSDGGDIDLVKVEENDVYVRLVGACSSCPSSTVTMKMGIERLLAEEFPQFRHLIQVA